MRNSNDLTSLVLYERLFLIREVEDRLAEIYPQEPRLIRCPMHLSQGQEAVAVGVCAPLYGDDYVFSNYRCHAHYLGKGGDLKAMIAELFGRETGCARGRGGSMHLVDPEVGFMGASAIVGSTIPLAVGSALAFKMSGENRVAVSFFGDAACEEGVFHESLNFASLKKLPVVFVCENNSWAVQSPFFQRQPEDNIFKRAIVYGISGVRVDGNNVFKVYEAAKEAVDKARSGGGPALIEARTLRIREHIESGIEDVRGRRTEEEITEALERCPVRHCRDFILQKGLVPEEWLRDKEKEIRQRIAEVIRKAANDPLPDSRLLSENIL